jgi:hypothetical protein
MTRYEPDSVETDELPDAVDALGVDGDGRTHLATTPVGGLTIYVETADGYDVFELAEMPVSDLADWIDHVGTQRGWNRLMYYENYAECIAEAVEAAQ